MTDVSRVEGLVVERHHGGDISHPVVIGLHAGVADRRCWQTVADRLADVVTLISYDRRGYGDTPAATAAFSDLDDLAAVIESIDAPEPLWLLGNSMGGRLALDYSLTAPDRVAGLILIAPGVSGSPERPLDDATKRLVERAEPAYDAGRFDEVNRIETHVWLDGPSMPEGRVSGPLRELALAMNAIVLANETLQEPHVTAADVDAWSRLEEIAAPVTIACGTLDVPAIAETSREAAQRLPHGEFVALPEVAHLPSLEAPDLVADLVRRAVVPRGA